MTAFRFFLILVIFCMVSLAWLVLGGTIEYRTADLKESLAKEVDSRWGPSGLVQRAPALSLTGAGDPACSDIEVRFDHENRYMGLVWFSTYVVDFRGTYTLAARAAGEKPDQFIFDLPEGARAFENLGVSLDGQARDVDECRDGAIVDSSQGPVLTKVRGVGERLQANRLWLQVPTDGQEHAVTVSYRTQGRDRWIYDVARGQPVLVKALDLVATTNFRDIDYPKGCVSPTPHAAEPADGGMKAAWHFQNRSTCERIGIEMPQRLNSGPIAARMAFYAPVSLFFFFTVLFTIILLKKIPLHPMHYLFISAGFFAFHILLAYLVDKINIHHAFWIGSIVSVFLITSYMRLVAGGRFALLYVGGAQLVYLVGFSYAFFATGWTGLTIVVVAILTLFFLMMATGRIDWNAVFSKPPARVPAPPAPPAAPPGA